MRTFKAGIACTACVLFAAQIQAATTFNLVMTGAAEVDAQGNLGVGDPDGIAAGFLTLDPDADSISWSFEYGNLDGTAVSGFHIHGPATPLQNAGVYVGFPLSSTAVPNGVQTGMLTNVGTQVDTILANPAMYYVNLHTSGTTAVPGYPAGAVRAQLPEPGSMALLAIGSLLIARRRRSA